MPSFRITVATYALAISSLCPLYNHEMEKEKQFDTLQGFKNALENWSVVAKFRYWAKKKRQVCPPSTKTAVVD
jgi:hypothetical protein